MNDNADHIPQEVIAVMTEQQRASSTYLWDNALAQARERISAGAVWLDPRTTAQLEGIGVAPGWACLEAGAGGGSITEWLCKRVGDKGRVLATDIDMRFVGELSYPNLDVQRHDITTDDVPEGEFDLVHARLLLEHLPGHALALSKLVATLKPGGWLLVRLDHLTCGVADPSGNPERLSVYQAALVSRPWMPTESDWTSVVSCSRCFEIRVWSTSKLKDTCACPLEVQPSVPLCMGARPFRDVYLTSGLTDDEVDRYFSLLHDPEFVMMSHLFCVRQGPKSRYAAVRVLGIIHGERLEQLGRLQTWYIS